MKDNHRLLHSAEKVLDFLINAAAIYLGFLVSELPADYTGRQDPLKQVLVAFLICLLSVLCYGYTYLYHSMRSQRYSYYIRRIVAVNFILMSFCLLLTALITDVFSYYLCWILVACFISTTLLIIKKAIIISILHRLRENKRNIKRVLLLTDSQEMTDEYLREIHGNPNFGYEVFGYVGNLAIEGLPHLGATADLDAVLKSNRPDEVVMAFETVRRKVVSKYVSICDDNCVKVLFVPAICGFFKSQRQVVQLDSIPLIDIRSNPLDNPVNQFIKRATDIVLSLFFIVLTSPIMLFTAIGVRISSPGPILFRQKRVGKNNKEFTIYKFRSMRVNNRENSGWTTDEDDRKTAFGNLIRKLSFDELPQFFNVLKGDMSIVGPRPEIPYYVDQFRKTVPLYMLKHALRPGITGQAQILGLRGDTSIELRIEEDINYIEHWSWLGDMRIILLTPFKAFNTHEKKPRLQKKNADSGTAGERETGAENSTDSREEERPGNPVTDIAPSQAEDAAPVSRPAVGQEGDAPGSAKGTDDDSEKRQ